VRATERGIEADLAIVNANIVTMDAARPRVEACAVKHAKFALVGTTDEVNAAIGPQTKVLDARGRTVVPGFIDAHLHPAPVYPLDHPLGVVDLRPPDPPTIEGLIDALREKAALTAKGQWVRGSRYMDTQFGRHPTREDLDRVSTEHPVLIRHGSGHACVVNSLALATTGITRNTPDPPGGAFERDAAGEPTGVCWETAAGPVSKDGGPPLPRPTREAKFAGMRLCLEQFAQKGLTSVGHAGAGPDMIRLYTELFAAGPAVRVNLMMSGGHLDKLKALGLRTGFGNEWLKIGPIKVFHGQSVSAGTCWLFEPYANRSDYYGIPPARSQEDLDELIWDIHEAGFQAAVHSNADREIVMVLDAFEKALKKLPRPDHRHRIEHCSVVTQEILERIKALGVVAVLHSYLDEYGATVELYDKKRWGLIHPNRTALEMGIAVAAHSDYSVSRAEPLRRIQSLVTRKSMAGKVYAPEQCLSVEQALRVFTLGSAYAAFEEGLKGSIERGKLADCVVLSADPAAVDPDTIRDIAVEQTIIGGVVVHRA